MTITIDPGAVFTLGDIKLEGDAADLMPANFGLIPGGDASSSAILRAEADIVRRLKEEAGRWPRSPAATSSPTMTR